MASVDCSDIQDGELTDVCVCVCVSYLFDIIIASNDDQNTSPCI